MGTVKKLHVRGPGGQAVPASLGPKGLRSDSKVSFKSIFPSDSHKSPELAGQSCYFHFIGKEVDTTLHRRIPL